MEKVKEVFSVYSPENLAEKMLDEKDPDIRDEYKGQILAYNDLLTITSVYEGKDLVKMKEYLERFDPYADNLNLFVNVYEPRAERVIASKIKALGLLKTNLLAYLNDYAGITIDSGIHSKKIKTEEISEGVSAESEVQEIVKKRKQVRP